jgi:uncharacterized membrane protein
MTQALAAVAGVTLTALVAPHVIGAWRGLHVGRSAVASHRRSVRVGVRLGRWQTVLVAVMVAALIGGAR